MKISKQARREAKQLFRTCQVNGLLDEARAREATDRLLADKPRGYVAVLNHFLRLVKLDAERRLARVESAVPLTGALQTEVKASLEKRYGRGLTFQFAHNPDLLGGLRVQVGSDLYDGSIRTRLNEVREAFESA
ncbi:MAG: F0F1 ATP synthase subunit delta [Verrucomicrobiota bacterium]